MPPTCCLTTPSSGPYAHPQTGSRTSSPPSSNTFATQIHLLHSQTCPSAAQTTQEAVHGAALDDVHGGGRGGRGDQDDAAKGDEKSRVNGNVNAHDQTPSPPTRPSSPATQPSTPEPTPSASSLPASLASVAQTPQETSPSSDQSTKNTSPSHSPYSPSSSPNPETHESRLGHSVHKSGRSPAAAPQQRAGGAPLRPEIRW